MAEPDYMTAADEFKSGLAENGFYLMSISDLMNETGDENLLILDVRLASLYADGHINGLHEHPRPKLVARMDQVPAGMKIAVVCQIDTNSAFAVSVLRIFGGHDAWMVEGGVPGWVAQGGELVTG